MRFIFSTFFALLILVNFCMAQSPFLWGQETILTKRFAMRQEAATSVHTSPPEIENKNIGGEKSIKKAVILSAIIPGTGEFYAKSYLKSAIFLATEIGAWAVNISYIQKGDEKDEEFRQFADEHWSERRYWSWVAYNAAMENIADAPFAIEDLIQDNSGRYLIPEEQYNSEIIEILRSIERNGLTGFSHRLPKTKTQQYYEMIGKYPHQFGAAWDDATFKYYDPETITPNFDFYRNMRHNANRLYNIAQWGLTVALVNHVVSAIDAGFTARSYNQSRELKIQMSYENYYYKGQYLNMLGVDVKW